MFIRRLSIRNVRGFDTVEVDLSRPDGTLHGWTVFAGRNGSGKSTILRALALAVVGPAPSRSLQESFADWIRSGACEASIELELLASPGDQLEAGRPPRDGEPRNGDVVKVRLDWRSAGGGEPLQKAEIEHRGRRRKKTDFGPWSENTTGWFVAGYGPFRRLSGHGADAQRLMLGPKRIVRLVSLFREDASLVECEQWLREIYLRQLEGDRQAQKLLEQVIALLNDGLLPNGVRVDRVDSKGLWVCQHEARLELDSLSDGYRAAAALVVDLVRHLHGDQGRLELDHDRDGSLLVTNEGVVLIDEMDVHLHVSWQQRIGFWLKRHFPQVQFLVTTHSPFICQAADPGGLIRLPMPGEAQGAEPVPEDVYYTVVHGTADDTVLTELFGLEVAHSEAAEQLHRRLAELEARHLRAELIAAEEAELASLRRQAPRSPISDVDRVLRRLSVK